MSPDERRDWFERQVTSLLEQYGEIQREQVDMSRIIEERTKEAQRNRDRVDRELDGKAERTDLTPILQRLDRLDARLGGTNKLLVGLLVSITLAAVGFGFAALQFAGSHP